MLVVRGAWPVKNRYIASNVSAEVATCTWLWSGWYTLVAPPMLSAEFPSPHTASVGTPPGGDVGRRAVEVHVMGDLRRPRRRAAEVALRDGGAERVADELDLVRPAPASSRATSPSRSSQTFAIVVVAKVESYSSTPIESAG